MGQSLPRYKIIVSHWLHRILLGLTPAGSACWNQYTSPQTDTFYIVSWYIEKVLFFCQMLSHFVSVDSYQHWRSSCFVFDFPKLNLCQHVFTLNVFICACKYILFLHLHMWINTIFSHADITGSFRASLVVGVHSILGHGGREYFSGSFMISWPNFLYCDWLENRIKNRPVIGWFGLSNESCVKMSKWCQIVKQM